LVQNWVPRTDSGKPGPLDQLDREILATHRFAQLFPSDTYPRELPRLRYYDVDSEDPFILLAAYRGVPATEVLPHMTAQDRHRLQISLLRALHFVGAAGMAHGRVDHDVLRWDSETRSVQLINFEYATPADIREDMWDAGLAVWRTTHLEHTGSEAPHLDADSGALRALLADVFVDPADRPSPADLLTRLREPTQIRVIDLDAQLQPGMRAFDSAMQRKRDHHTENRVAPWRSRFRHAPNPRHRQRSSAARSAWIPIRYLGIICGVVTNTANTTSLNWRPGTR
jgi:hypothetical protein